MRAEVDKNWKPERFTLNVTGRELEFLLFAVESAPCSSCKYVDKCEEGDFPFCDSITDLLGKLVKKGV